MRAGLLRGARRAAVGRAVAGRRDARPGGRDLRLTRTTHGGSRRRHHRCRAARHGPMHRRCGEGIARPPQRRGASLHDVAQRLDLFVAAVFGRGFPIRIAEPPAPPTLLSKLFARKCRAARQPSRQPTARTSGFRRACCRRAACPHWRCSVSSPCSRPRQHAPRRGSARTAGTAGAARTIGLSSLCSRPSPPRRRADAHHAAGPACRACSRFAPTRSGRRPAPAVLSGARQAVEGFVRRMLEDTAMALQPAGPEESLEAPGALRPTCGGRFRRSQPVDVFFLDPWTGELRPAT